MKPLGEEAKKYCREGHILERPFLKQFHKHSQDGVICGYNSIAIQETLVDKLLHILRCLWLWFCFVLFHLQTYCILQTYL